MVLPDINSVPEDGFQHIELRTLYIQAQEIHSEWQYKVYCVCCIEKNKDKLSISCKCIYAYMLNFFV